MFPAILKSELIENKAKFKNDEAVIYFSRKQLEFNFSFFKEQLGLMNNEVFFSVKTNYESQVLKTLKALKSNFEIASLGELELMKKYSISAERLIFSNPVKIPEHIIKAYNYGVNLFAYDTESELAKIQRNAPKSKVFLRLSIQNDGAEWKLEDKFGVVKEKAVQLLKLAAKYELKACGIAIHVGWNNNKVKNWEQTLFTIKTILAKAKKENIQLDFINMGGGFPAHNIDQYKALLEIASKINSIKKEIEENYKLRFIAEPGSFLIANTAILSVGIYDIIKRGSKKWIFVNSGIMQGFAWILSNLKYSIFHLGQLDNENAKTESFIITGPTLDSHDVFSYDTNLPKNTKIGDILCVFPAGAYISSSQKYNHYSFPEFKEL